MKSSESRLNINIRGCRCIRASRKYHRNSALQDLITAWQERKMAADRRQPARPFRLRRFLRDPLVVPETKPLNQLVDEFRTHHTHLALVVDEFGTITGMVTLEDVLEQIFGEIGDEHDVRRPMPAAGAPVIELDGGTISAISLRNTRSSCPATPALKLWRIYAAPAGIYSVAGRIRDVWRSHFHRAGMDRNRIARVKIVSAGRRRG